MWQSDRLFSLDGLGDGDASERRENLSVFLQRKKERDSLLKYLT